MVDRPKRRKHKDNPYTLLNIDEKGIYKVSFKDGIGILRVVEITKEVYEAFDRFELEDKSQLHEYERHIEHSEMYDESLYNRAVDKPINLEDGVIKKATFEDLKNAINKLTDVQRRRIKMYYFDELNLEQIAKIEQTSFQMISKSIKQGIENLKKILKNKI